MTTIEEILGRCAVKVEFARKEIDKMPLKCYSCMGYKSDAMRADCEDYKPFLLRHKVFAPLPYVSPSQNLKGGKT